MKAAELAPVPDLRRIDARFIVDQMIATPDTAPEGVFASVEQGGHISLPDYMDGNGGTGDRIVLPSLAVETFRGNRARLVDLHTTDARLDRSYRDTVRSRGGMEERIQGMAFDSAVKMLDTSGAQGLHHLHRSDFFPNTIYYATSRGNGLRPHVFMTRVGDLREGNDRIPVLGMITATKDPASERRFFDLMGGK
ncbi:MAG TPA: hypothetical protein VLH86_01325 [Patescibacteria group bacterium]|nr:hypothetical protein [Patescibacteria group bacterium]